MATTLSVEDVARRRDRQDEEVPRRASFRIAALYGLSETGTQIPVSETESIDSGQVCLTMDPDAPLGGNVGIVDFVDYKVKVTYTAQLVFPGLYKLITEGNHDPSLLNPVRVTATDSCEVTENYAGWRALGCLEFLPGSFWWGAHGT